MIVHSECSEYLDSLEPNQFDSCVTDPPYFMTSSGNKLDTKKLLQEGGKYDQGGFMGKKWDGAKVEVEKSNEVPEELL